MLPPSPTLLPLLPRVSEPGPSFTSRWQPLVPLEQPCHRAGRISQQLVSCWWEDGLCWWTGEASFLLFFFSSAAKDTHRSESFQSSCGDAWFFHNPSNSLILYVTSVDYIETQHSVPHRHISTVDLIVMFFKCVGETGLLVCSKKGLGLNQEAIWAHKLFPESPHGCPHWLKTSITGRCLYGNFHNNLHHLVWIKPISLRKVEVEKNDQNPLNYRSLTWLRNMRLLDPGAVFMQKSSGVRTRLFHSRWTAIRLVGVMWCQRP